MKLLTYRLDTKNTGIKHQFLNVLYKDILIKDPLWHFFLDPEGGTLRFLPQNELKVKGWLIKNAKSYQIKWKKRLVYEPKKHEYWGVSYLGDDILPMFHEMSVLCVNYPGYVVIKPIFERLNHGLINMIGVHNFETEAWFYMQLAEGRARLIGKTPYYLPKIFYKWYFKLKGIIYRV